MMRRLLLLFLAILVAPGCVAPTKPNVSALYGVPELRAKLPQDNGTFSDTVLPQKAQALFLYLYSQDPGLALEVGKLPEFQGAIDEKTVVALERFTHAVKMATPSQKENLTMLLNEGKPSVRRYCTPLQAIFWIFEKSDPDDILGWPLLKLLDEAWYPNKLEFTPPDRWKDFDLVTERLNSPSLIDYYEIRNFRYDIVGDPRGGPSPRTIFYLKRGSCSYYTSFTVYCLKSSGYEARPVRILMGSIGGHWYSRGYDHLVCEFVDKDGVAYVLDNGRPRVNWNTNIYTGTDYYNNHRKMGYGYNM